MTDQANPLEVSGGTRVNSSGPERELLRLLAHGEAEVRGLTALLVGKLAGKISLDAVVINAVRALARDENARVRGSAKMGVAGIERGTARAAQKGAKGLLIPPHGGYADLASYRMSEIAFDGTVFFCNRHISIRSRTHDQMVQAARSGKQNIVEGSMASGTSKKTELKLVGVARASFEELLEDFQDFLRNRRLSVWDKNDPRARIVRGLAYEADRSYATYKPYFENESPEVAANALLCVTHQACYLLDRQLVALETAFVEEGGFTERLYRVRSEQRKRKKE